MSFIKGRVASKPRSNPYERLGYRSNPFPAQGDVHGDVFVPRPELDELQLDLSAFLDGGKKGSVWALSGAQGVGKSNFLHYLATELREMEGWGHIHGTAYRLLPSLALSPARVAEEIVAAIGEERIQRLVAQARTVPGGYQSTDFERFWRNAFGPGSDAEASARFLVRWLGGHQTYKAERDRYGILARERLPPAVAFPYLRGLVEMLEKANLLERILLLDEFEDVQLLRTAARTEYVQTLKALLNAFNWRGLYVIVAGAPGAFTAIQESYPSLSSRLRVAELHPLRDADAAVTLASAYKMHARLGSKMPEKLPPSDLEIEKTYIRLFRETPGGVITQRHFLTELNGQIERLVPKDGGEPAPSTGGGVSRGVRPR